MIISANCPISLAIVDSLNYGGLVDPWAAAGYQAESGMEKFGCSAPAPGHTDVFGPPASPTNSSAGRFPDGADSGSNCNDFRTQAATTLPIAADAGATNIKVVGVAGFVPGESIMIGTGEDEETAVIATVGTAGATIVRTAAPAGTTAIPVANAAGFSEGQRISIGAAGDSETAVIASIDRFPAPVLIVAARLAHAHAADTPVSGRASRSRPD